MRLAFLILCGLLAMSGAAAAESPAPPATAATTDKLRLLLDLAGDADLRALLDGRRPAGAAAQAPAPGPPEPDTMAGGLGSDLQNLRDHLGALARAVPRLGGEFAEASAMLGDMLGHGDALSLGLFLPLFVALGFGGEWLFRVNTRGFLRRLLALPLDTVRERVAAVLARFAYGLGLVASYALGSIGAMLPFEWTPKFKQVLLALLLASVITRLSAVAGRLLLAPRAPRFRVVPLDTPAAVFLFHRVVAAGLLLGIGSQLVTLVAAFGFSALSQELCRDAVDLLALALGLVTVAGCPAHASDRPDGAELAAPRVEWHHLRTGWARLGLSATLVLLWCFAVSGADKPFWALLFAVGGPCAVAVTQRSIRHLLRPTEAADALGLRNGLLVVFLERGVRTLMIVGSAALLAHMIGLDVTSLAMHDTVSTRITRGVIGVVVIVLVADFLWHVIVALIDRKLAGTLEGEPGDVGGHAARLQTLLPITRNLSLAALATVAGTMVLAALGVEIGPLIASAGVVGVAIGFGAQTLVKDIISGIFYLVDDAFRIGEYIQSGTYKGTVESFSLRSVKLRHQRGALYTIPFGTLGAVQNLSRDWVVDKIRLNVRYDSDLEQVRKIIKRIGETLAADPELGPGIIKPMKLQGVAQFGDYAVQLQTKMTTVPGDVQFASRRRALLLIKEAFQQHGIGFALPTVQVSGEGSDGAAAQSALTLVKAAEATAAE